MHCDKWKKMPTTRHFSRLRHVAYIHVAHRSCEQYTIQIISSTCKKCGRERRKKSRKGKKRDIKTICFKRKAPCKKTLLPPIPFASPHQLQTELIQSAAHHSTYITVKPHVLQKLKQPYHTYQLAMRPTGILISRASILSRRTVVDCLSACFLR